MAAVLEVSGLCKRYPKFYLDHVSFSVSEASIMGFIGRNGAGKTTALKSVLNLVSPTEGEIRYFGMELRGHEDEIKQRIGYAGGAVDYYKKRKIRETVSITRGFYREWDDVEYRRYLELFGLDEDKTPSQLSEGMKVKLSLAIAMSHHARLLILDEPTSGLDPVSRDELLDIFRYLKKQGVAILFSTHITSDLDKCADHITYIREGKLVTTGPVDEFLAAGGEKGFGSSLEDIMLGYEKEARHEAYAE